MNTRPPRTEGFSLIGILIVLAVVLVVALAVTKQYSGLGARDPATGVPLNEISTLDQARQQRTLSDMQAIATANAAIYAETGAYASSLADLESRRLLVKVPKDGWGNDWTYEVGRNSYTLTSLGADGAPGPKPPAAWRGGSWEVDLILTNGQFTQAPSRR
ncbi:MAG: type II secretion system protein GspG [Acidobacteriota bacterium]